MPNSVTAPSEIKFPVLYLTLSEIATLCFFVNTLAEIFLRKSIKTFGSLVSSPNALPSLKDASYGLSSFKAHGQRALPLWEMAQ